MSAFSATQTTSQTNATGGSVGNVTVVYNQEDFDSNGDYNPSTGIFTAPSCGIYLFTASVKLSNLVLANSFGAFYLDVSNGSNYYRFAENNPGACKSNQNTQVYEGATLLQLTAGATVRMRVSVTGNSSENVTILADYTHFSGTLISR